MLLAANSVRLKNGFVLALRQNPDYIEQAMKDNKDA